jgi:peptidoglycan/LPS O-acetylase OafA/YrhL
MACFLRPDKSKAAVEMKMLKTLFQSGHGRLEDKSNTFTAMRIAFAVLILYGHAIMIPIGLPIYGEWAVFIDTIVQYALDGFFILSGYMIAASIARSNDMTGYTLSRILRIFPGLIATVLLLWLVVGPLFTELSWTEYWSRGETLAFPLMVLSQADPLAGLPEVFNASPLAAMDGPLWTIRYELLAYLGVGILASIGLFQRGAFVIGWAALACIGSVAFHIWGYSGIGDATIGSMARFAPAFLIGSAFFAARDQVPLSLGYVGLALLAAIVSQGNSLGPVMLQIALAWTFLWIGFLDIPGRLGSALRNIEDVSYGIYILHWPIGMMVFSLYPEMGSSALFAIMLPGSIAAGWVLRVSVEKPALAMKRKIRDGLRTKQAVAAG